MELKLEEMCKWEREKAIYLMGVAEDLGLDTSGYGELAVNQNLGNTYLWLEDSPVTLYLPITCELTKSDVQCSVYCPECGQDVDIDLGENSLKDLEEWANDPETYTCDCNHLGEISK